MQDPLSFQDLLRLVRAGDAGAATELVQRYEPTIRRAVRFRLFDPRLRRVLDSVDICQSVLGSFFIRMATGQYELEQPEQLLGLLVTMARNKVISKARKFRAQTGAESPGSGGHQDPEEIACSDPSPSKQVAAQELLGEFHRRLLPDEKQLLQLRSEGLNWEQIADQVGGNAVALRKKWSRTLDRINQELGIAEESHA
jgi:RNA polymerase sigma factor (sigma-70 family)